MSFVSSIFFLVYFVFSSVFTKYSEIETFVTLLSSSIYLQSSPNIPDFPGNESYQQSLFLRLFCLSSCLYQMFLSNERHKEYSPPRLLYLFSCLYQIFPEDGPNVRDSLPRISFKKWQNAAIFPEYFLAISPLSGIAFLLYFKLARRCNHCLAISPLNGIPLVYFTLARRHNLHRIFPNNKSFGRHCLSRLSLLCQGIHDLNSLCLNLKVQREAPRRISPSFVVLLLSTCSGFRQQFLEILLMSGRYGP